MFSNPLGTKKAKNAIRTMRRNSKKRYGGGAALAKAFGM